MYLSHENLAVCLTDMGIFSSFNFIKNWNVGRKIYPFLCKSIGEDFQL